MTVWRPERNCVRLRLYDKRSESKWNEEQRDTRRTVVAAVNDGLGTQQRRAAKRAL